MSSPSSEILARTWNGNESGLLWEKLWMRDSEGPCAKLIASGVFVGPQRFPDEASFWAAYERDATEFNGRRQGSTS